MTLLKPRPRKCKMQQPGCEGKYRPRNSLQPCCLNPKCILENKQRLAEKKWRKEKAEFRLKSKTKSDWTKEAQDAFNKWVRVRDYLAGYGCISCGTKEAGQYHAGHYRTTKAAPELRFHPLNAHLQCARCNNFDSGNIVEYRINLVKRIGRELVEWIEGPHDPKKYTIDDLKHIKSTYTKAAKELEEGGANGTTTTH